MSFMPFFLQAAGNAAAGAEQAPQGPMGGTFGMLVPLILIVVIMYFFMIRPQSKKQKETQKMLDALKKGDKVVTIGGIHGVISSVKENTVIVKLDEGCKVEFNRTAIATVVVDKPAVESKPAEKKGWFGFGKKAKAETVAAEIKDSDDKKAESTAADAAEPVENTSDSGAKKDE